ncbi:hypothetical protein KUF54_15475 [Comamonas sp. Y33R10-2]|uniref:hypothetical protein n=1 Tax=Comamonas sp. Y33R10-2 TaxID=2853257 RepID=UPI001C5C882C|nr:hypothetical protein [Comamonas sp. Y33R10-2]QXZ09397.1 hypothetical protein KUF54_15475 [Comamonas sp. Y33R10-2]
MRSEVIVVLDGDLEYRVDTQSLPTVSSDEGRRWLDQQFTSLECEPLRATGKVLLADKLVVVAREAQNRPELFESTDWRNTYAVAAQAVLSKPLIRVDVPAMSISY